MSRENVDRFSEGRRGVQPHGHTRRPCGSWIPQVQFEHRLSELQGSSAGLESVNRFFADVVEHFDALKVDCPDIRDLDDRVLALGTSRLTGKGSGVETELPFAVVARFRDGRMTHFTDFGDRDQALEAARLVGVGDVAGERRPGLPSD